MTSDEVVGSRIARLRGAMSQQELARRMANAGVKWSQSTVWSVETGRRPLRVSEAVVLCDILGVELGEMLGDVDSVLASQFAARLHRSRETLVDVLAEMMTRTADAAIAADIQGMGERVLRDQRDEVQWTLIDDVIEHFVQYAESSIKNPETEEPGPIWRAILDEWSVRADLLRSYLTEVYSKQGSSDGEHQETP